MMVSAISSGAGATPYAAAFDPERALNSNSSWSAPRWSNSSSNFFESLSAALSKSTSFQDRVDELIQQLKLQDDQALTSKPKKSDAVDLEKAQANSDRAGQATDEDGDVDRIEPEFLTLLALPPNRSVDTLA